MTKEKKREPVKQALLFVLTVGLCCAFLACTEEQSCGEGDTDTDEWINSCEVYAQAFIDCYDYDEDNFDDEVAQCVADAEGGFWFTLCVIHCPYEAYDPEYWCPFFTECFDACMAAV